MLVFTTQFGPLCWRFLLEKIMSLDLNINLFSRVYNFSITCWCLLWIYFCFCLPLSRQINSYQGTVIIQLRFRVYHKANIKTAEVFNCYVWFWELPWTYLLEQWVADVYFHFFVSTELLKIQRWIKELHTKHNYRAADVWRALQSTGNTNIPQHSRKNMQHNWVQ